MAANNVETAFRLPSGVNENFIRIKGIWWIYDGSTCEICEIFRISILKNIYERQLLESLG